MWVCRRAGHSRHFQAQELQQKVYVPLFEADTQGVQRKAETLLLLRGSVSVVGPHSVHQQSKCQRLALARSVMALVAGQHAQPGGLVTAVENVHGIQTTARSLPPTPLRASQALARPGSPHPPPDRRTGAMQGQAAAASAPSAHPVADDCPSTPGEEADEPAAGSPPSALTWRSMRTGPAGSYQPLNTGDRPYSRGALAGAPLRACSATIDAATAPPR
eukprot:scaffold4273_cov389-Prasinococcus_capsulatus_cf.AAC.2